MFDSQFEHRSEPRKMHMSRAEISWHLRDGNLCTYFAMTEDISAHGMGLRMKRPIPVGTTVQIKTKNHTQQGVVRWCFRAELDHLIGVQLCPAPATQDGKNETE